LAGIKVGINATNNSINAMKDSMDTHFKTFTEIMDTRLKTFMNTMDTHLKTFTDTMNTHSKIITAVLIVSVTFFLLITAVLVMFCVLAVSLLYQRPAPDNTYNTHPNSGNTPGSTLTSMFRNSVTGKDLKVDTATEGETAIAYIDAGDEGYSFTEASVTCQLRSELTGDVTNCSVQYIVMTNQFQIKYHTTSRGRHQLHIKVEGEHIKGSPFTVTVTGKTDTPIKIDKNGICSDHSNDHTQVF
jgi:hypothetical protein